MKGFSSKRTVLKVDLSSDPKIQCLQALLCTFQLRFFSGWGSEGVNIVPGKPLLHFLHCSSGFCLFYFWGYVLYHHVYLYIYIFCITCFDFNQFFCFPFSYLSLDVLKKLDVHLLWKST